MSRIGGCWIVAASMLALALSWPELAEGQDVVDATSIRGKVLCGYQGWFRCPDDASGLGWIHWSRDTRRVTPSTMTFEMWPDLTGFPAAERFAAPGFRFPDGKPAELFSSDNAATVLRHFEWMRDHGIDGVWLQHFAVELPGGPSGERVASRARVLDHVRQAAEQTGRTWAITFDISGMPLDRVSEVLIREWRRLVDLGITRSPRYLHQDGKPVVQVWGYYHGKATNAISTELANQLADFFKGPGPTASYLVGGGDWAWRKDPDPAWQASLGRLDAYAPWNVANYSTDPNGIKQASMGDWPADKRESEARGVLWIPVVYPGFSWNNLQNKPPGTTTIPRDGGRFLWEQFHEAVKLGADSVFVAMFDEVDEGTAIFKVTSNPPTPGHFVGYDGYPSDWYLRLVGEGTKMLRKERPITREIPIKIKP